MSSQVLPNDFPMQHHVQFLYPVHWILLWLPISWADTGVSCTKHLGVAAALMTASTSTDRSMWPILWDNPGIQEMPPGLFGGLLLRRGSGWYTPSALWGRSRWLRKHPRAYLSLYRHSFIDIRRAHSFRSGLENAHQALKNVRRMTWAPMDVEVGMGALAVNIEVDTDHCLLDAHIQEAKNTILF